MKNQKENVRVVSFSVPESVTADMEELTRIMGYTNRSELIRDSIRMLKKSRLDIENMDGKAEGVIITLYDHSAGSEVSEIRHRNMALIKSFMHTDCNHRSKTCCDVLFVSGQAEKIKALIFEMGVVKSVNEVKLFVA